MNCYNINSFLQKWEVLYISKKKPKTYNHYVPQFYLKNFSGNNSIGVYNFERNKFIDEAAIRKVGGKDYTEKINVWKIGFKIWRGIGVL